MDAHDEPRTMDTGTEAQKRSNGKNSPDIMNDPAYETNPQHKDKSSEDVNTCRICRGEGTKEEELFYPCKCSGSIKFVHQSCLMVWLSHSHKKHCELCKTPFRFTKLYDAHMPKSVPVPVFLRQAVLHTWTSLSTWARMHLVAFVWGLWLPWCIRAVWRGLFWVGDGGWVDWKKRSLQDAQDLLQRQLAMDRSSSLAESTPVSREELASAILSNLTSKLRGPWQPFKEMLINSRVEPITLKLFKWVYRQMAQNHGSPSASLPATNLTSVPDPSARSPSWLSDLPMLRSPTHSQFLNNVIIDIVEGVLITILVVIGFILIFLIREWVMQQQQNLLMGQEGNQRALLPANPAAQAQAREGHGPDQVPADNGAQGDAVDEAAANAINAPGREARIFARPRRRLQRRATLPEGQGPARPNGTAINALDRNETNPAAEEPSSTSHARTDETESVKPPAMPNREVIARAMEITTSLEGVQPGSTADVFKDLWSRSGQNPSEVLNIIEAEGRNEDLRWLVLFMKQLEGSSAGSPLGHTTPSSALNDGGILEQPDIFDSPIESETKGSETPHSSEPKAELVTDHRPFHDPASSQIEGDSLPQYDNSDMQQIPNPDATTQSSLSDANEDQWSVIAEGSTTPRHASLTQSSSGTTPQTSPLIPVTGVSNRELGSSQPDQSIHSDADDTAVPVADTEEHIMIAEPPVAENTMWEKLLDFMWGGVPAPADLVVAPAADEEHIVNDLANEAPFVPIVPRQRRAPAQNDPAQNGAAQNPDVAGAAAAPAPGLLDPNAGEGIDEIEDMEGVMELMGMQGPIIGLIQNGMFCAFLVALTIATALWLPYMLGKLFIIMLAQPLNVLTQPLRVFSTIADMVVDFCIFSAGCLWYWTDSALSGLCSPIIWTIPQLRHLAGSKLLAITARDYAERALARLAVASMDNSEILSRTLDIPRFSVIAHESLHQLQRQAFSSLEWILHRGTDLLVFIRQEQSVSEVLGASVTVGNIFLQACLSKLKALINLGPRLLRINPMRISFPRSFRTALFDYTLAEWGAKDRTIAIIGGYLFVALLGVIYLRLAAAMRGTNRNGKVDTLLADILYQAGGVTKVVFIISIEMMLFPLYCGVLLDIALLPLFGNASFMSRIEFTMESTSTSLFIHWFIGTCYMFHFALFVSMCRKIFRTGVLFFIRDPDDPTFHPVRDVLERSVSTQLYKISFSALVYGGLVIFCLGGVVWGIASSPANVFPIQWSSSEPLLEFPIDLILYNFLMPLAVKFFKPSVGLTSLYRWWFQCCARWLRLTDFLFGEGSSEEQKSQIRRRWSDLISAKYGSPPKSPPKPAEHVEHEATKDDDQDGVRDGRFVQAPASDSVRIPKGQPTFIDVDKDYNPVHQSADTLQAFDGRNQNHDQFQKVYIPPFFRLRMIAFVALVWLFAASTGLSVTILPLILGRKILSHLVPGYLRMNDIYAFSIGIYILGPLLLAFLHRRRIVSFLRPKLTPGSTNVKYLIRRSWQTTQRALGLLYVYSALAVLLPALVSLIIQCYMIIPLQTYVTSHPAFIDAVKATESSPNPSNSTSMPDTPLSVSGSIISTPIINLLQDWTLGILYVKIFVRLILWSAPSRPATALRAVIRNGYIDPDIQLATRGFIIPAALSMGLVLVSPLGLAWLALQNPALAEKVATDEVARENIYRYAYPFVAGMVAVGMVLWEVVQAFGRWRKKVKDEVYLIGERLHNYGGAKRKRSANHQDRVITDKGKEKERAPSSVESGEIDPHQASQATESKGKAKEVAERPIPARTPTA